MTPMFAFTDPLGGVVNPLTGMLTFGVVPSTVANPSKIVRLRGIDAGSR